MKKTEKRGASKLWRGENQLDWLMIKATYDLGGGFKDSLFSPLPGEMIQFD